MFRTINRGFVLLLVLCCMVFVGGCSQSAEPTDTGSGDVTESVIGNIPENSILAFTGDELNGAMAAGEIPVSCSVLYDEMGSRPEVTVTDEELIKDLYNRLGHITIKGETNTSITDAYHHISFELRAGTVVTYNFEDTLWCHNGINYETEGSGRLWSKVRELQEEE